MKNIAIKKIATAVALSFAVVTATAQDITSYFMTDAVETKFHNAAFAPDRGYLALPMIGGMTLSTNGNMSLGTMFRSIDGSLVPILDTRVSSADALSGLKDVNSFGMDSRLNILGFGGYGKSGKSFWSFDLSLRTSMSFAMPYEFFDFMKNTPDNTSIKDLNIYMDSYAEAAFGYSRPVIFDNLIVGVRVKVLAGLMSASLNIDKMDFTLSSDIWSAAAQGTLNINASGVAPTASKNDDGETIYNIDDIEGTPDGIAGIGAAVDFGATYTMFNDRLKLSAAVNDLGFIKWKRDCNTTATIANDFEFSGVDVTVGDDGDVSTDDSSTDIAIDDIEFVAQESQDTTKSLQANIKLGGEYNFFDNRIGLGAVYNTYLYRAKSYHALTGIATFRPNGWFSVAGSYSLSNSTGNSLGLALNIAPGVINFYLASDLLMSKKSVQYIPINQSSMSFSFGLAFSFGKGSRREGI
ncbi:MAG: DUF5723 family protein [Rikenellaceae bacterium]